MTWRSCDDDPPNSGKWVLVRSRTPRHYDSHKSMPWGYFNAYWHWAAIEKKRVWRDVLDGRIDTTPVGGPFAEWMELPK